MHDRISTCTWNRSLPIYFRMHQRKYLKLTDDLKIKVYYKFVLECTKENVVKFEID